VKNYSWLLTGKFCNIPGMLEAAYNFHIQMSSTLSVKKLDNPSNTFQWLPCHHLLSFNCFQTQIQAITSNRNVLGWQSHLLQCDDTKINDYPKAKAFGSYLAKKKTSRHELEANI
jgi:hypothetical protein